MRRPSRPTDAGSPREDGTPFADIAHENFVYVFDASTGAIVARVGPFGDVINHLAFSPDGRWLAATSIAGVGLKVIDAQTWRIVAEDQTYADDSYGAAFGPDGRLYTVAYDGKLRQYGPGPAFKKEREVATDGRQAAVLRRRRSRVANWLPWDSSIPRKVDIYDAATLKFRVAADTKGIDNGDLGAVAWSSDGAHSGRRRQYYHQLSGQLETSAPDVSAATDERIGDASAAQRQYHP